jgi:uncharacterized protein YhfF
MGTKSRETIYGGSVRAAAERATEARKQADRLAVAAWNARMLGFQGPAQPSQRWVWLSRSEMPWLQHASDRGARPRAATEDNADPRTGTLHAVQGLLTASRATVQAEPSGGPASHQDHGERSALDMVAGGTIVRIVMDWQTLETFSFGDHPALADELIGLVFEGKKRATCWAVNEGLKGAAVGKAMVALDGKNRPRVVLKTIELTQRQFDQVDEAFAYDEGEGDRSLAYWREAHKRYFTRAGLFELQMMLWCERFRVEHVIERY